MTRRDGDAVVKGGRIMVRLYVVLAPLVFALWAFCVVHVVMSKNDDIRHLPKVGWLVLVLLFPLVGSVAWLVAGRPRTRRATAYERPAPAFPEYDRPGRAAGTHTASDGEFLRRCRERAEEQRRRAAEQRKRAEEHGRKPEEGPDPQQQPSD